jgi:hypothetical protein
LSVGRRLRSMLSLRARSTSLDQRQPVLQHRRTRTASSKFRKLTLPILIVRKGEPRRPLESSHAELSVRIERLEEASALIVQRLERLGHEIERKFDAIDAKLIAVLEILETIQKRDAMLRA